MWGATAPSFVTLSQRNRFNPRTRVGCDSYHKIFNKVRSVSIHAPVWGATNHKAADNLVRHVSIHAPVWGATLSQARRKNRLSFNPRTRVGCDKLMLPQWCQSCFSIHAPVWGATARVSFPIAQVLFQSTHPCGVRPRSF